MKTVGLQRPSVLEKVKLQDGSLGCATRKKQKECIVEVSNVQYYNA